MKKLLIIAAFMAAALSTSAQGTVNFVNRITGTLDAPVFGIDGVTPLNGSGFMAQLYAGTSADSLQAVGNPAPFRTGTGAGYWNPTAAPSTEALRVVNGIAGGANAFVQVVAWDVASGATYAAAGIKGASPVFQVALGGAGNPPSTPAVLTGLQSFSLVPEPSTIALGLLGAAALLLRRRK
jgi:hypothetical protein